MEPARPIASVYFRSLGCPKNQVDTELMLGALASHGYAICEELEQADAAVVNTCSFIESARQESLDRPAVLKRINSDLAEDPELRERFEREARTAAALHHQNVVAVYDRFTHRGASWRASFPRSMPSSARVSSPSWARSSSASSQANAAVCTSTPGARTCRTTTSRAC